MDAPALCPICATPLGGDGFCPTCDEAALADRPALAADGALDRRPRAPAPAGRMEYRRAPAPEEPLELDHVPTGKPVPPAAAAPVEAVRPRRRRRVWPWVLAGFLALSVAGAAAVGVAGYRLARDLLDELAAAIPALLPGAPARERPLEGDFTAPVLVIDSEPPGAEVWLGDQLLGVTPLAADNPYPEGERFELRVRKPGFREERLPAAGGAPAELRVTLRRR